MGACSTSTAQAFCAGEVPRYCMHLDHKPLHRLFRSLQIRSRKTLLRSIQTIYVQSYRQLIATLKRESIIVDKERPTAAVHINSITTSVETTTD
jgi:hypothetical protein